MALPEEPIPGDPAWRFEARHVEAAHAGTRAQAGTNHITVVAVAPESGARAMGVENETDDAIMFDASALVGYSHADSMLELAIGGTSLAISGTLDGRTRRELNRVVDANTARGMRQDVERDAAIDRDLAIRERMATVLEQQAAAAMGVTEPSEPLN